MTTKKTKKSKPAVMCIRPTDIDRLRATIVSLTSAKKPSAKMLAKVKKLVKNKVVCAPPKAKKAKSKKAKR